MTNKRKLAELPEGTAAEERRKTSASLYSPPPGWDDYTSGSDQRPAAGSPLTSRSSDLAIITNLDLLTGSPAGKKTSTTF